VASLTAANATDLNTLRSAIIPAFARTMLDLRARILAIAGNPRNSAQAMADDTAQARSEAATQIEQIEGRAQDAAGRIYARLDKATEGAPDVQQAILDELQESRAWNRARMALDSGQDMTDVIKAAGARLDRVALRAMRDELPAYLDAQGRAYLAEVALASTDLYEGPLLGPVEKYARDLRAEMAIGVQNAAGAAAYAKHEASGASVHGNLPGWAAKSNVVVAEQGPQA
jgi:hypothetical protein